MINPIYSADKARYSGGMKYRRCGKSGILLPEVSLGLWHNFGDVDTLANSLQMAHFAFDKGITHFDLANNYGPSYGSAEETFGLIMKKSFMPYRDELFISTKAGHDMWEGPYGNWGSRKYLMSSLNQSLKRMNLEYVDHQYSGEKNNGRDKEEFVPHGFISHQINDSTWVGLAITVPYGLATDYGEDWNRKDHGYKAEMTVINFNPNVAWKATDTLSIGAGLALQYVDAKFGVGYKKSTDEYEQHL